MSKVNNKKSGGIGAGFLLLLVGIGLLWYNEGRTVKTQSAINEARKNYIQVKSDKVDDKNEGKLVATKGELDISESSDLVDSVFGITVKGVKLVRTVEVYQWKESCEEEDGNKKNCTYEKVWSSDLIDSASFKEVGHDNPTSKLYEDSVWVASNVRMGAYTLPNELVNQLSCDKNKSNQDLEKEYNKSVESLKVDGNYITNISDNIPQIGNVRISFSYLDGGNVSVLAVQTGNTFEAYTAKSGKDVYKIYKGNYTGAQILEKMVKSNNTWKWMLRLLGVILIIGGFNSIFSLITNLTDKIPVLGKIIGGATSFVSSILGIALSLIVIAIAWFRFRPLLSIILLVVVVCLVIVLRMYNKNKHVDKV